MKTTIMLAILAAGCQLMAADKIFMVNGKVVPVYEAFKSAERGVKVERCSEVEGSFIVDGKAMQKALKCQEVVLFSNKSGMPIWKAKTSGQPWK